MLRKIILLAIGVFIPSTMLYFKLVVGFSFLILFLKAMQWMKPYRSDAHNELE